MRPVVLVATGSVGAREAFHIFDPLSLAVRETVLVVPVHVGETVMAGATVSIEAVIGCGGVDLFPAVSMTPTT